MSATGAAQHAPPPGFPDFRNNQIGLMTAIQATLNCDGALIPEGEQKPD